MKDFRIPPGLQTAAPLAKKTTRQPSREEAGAFDAALTRSLNAASPGVAGSMPKPHSAPAAPPAEQRLGADASVKQELASAREDYNQLLKMQSQLARMYHQLEHSKPGGDS